MSEAVPFYALYVLLFADAGLSESQISALLAIWSAVAIIAEVPSGALADRWSRRGALVTSGLLQAAGYLLWVTVPGFAGFAVGFVLWGLGGAFASGAQEALVYDGLAAVGAEDRYVLVQGWVTSAQFVAFVPAVAAATVLVPLGGVRLAGWVSIAVCLAGAAIASRLPEVTRTRREPGEPSALRRGITDAMDPAVRRAVLAVAVIGGLDAIEEYFPLLAAGWGVPTNLVPASVLIVTLVGAAGAACAGVAASLRPSLLALLYGAALLTLGLVAALDGPAALVALGAFYGVYQVVLVVADARLQRRIAGSARATTTSVAGLGIELVGFAVFGIWALGQVALVAAVWLLAALALPRWIGDPPPSGIITSTTSTEEAPT